MVAVVATGEEAVDLALSATADVLVVMDLSLAGEMNGIEAARQVRRRGGGCRVVFHTAQDDPEQRERMLALRNAVIVRKPGHIARLVEAVSSAPRLVG